jgi:hypothetical protein
MDVNKDNAWSKQEIIDGIKHKRGKWGKTCNKQPRPVWEKIATEVVTENHPRDKMVWGGKVADVYRTMKQFQ